MKKKTLRLLSVVLAAVLAMSAFSIMPAGAAETAAEAAGSNGTTGDCAWELDEYGALRIVGNGAMADYASASDCPWYADRADVKYIIVENGVTRIGNCAFDGLNNAVTASLYGSLSSIGERAFYATAIKSVNIPEGVTEIGKLAFRNCGSLRYVSLPETLEVIGNNAFAGAALDSVIFPNKETQIGMMSFGFDSKMKKDNSFVVYGYPESTAQTYAENNGFEFVEYDGIARNICVHLGDAVNAATGARVSKACVGERIKIVKWRQKRFYLTGFTSPDVEIEKIGEEYFFTMPATSVEVFVEGEYPQQITVDLSDDEPFFLDDERLAVVEAQIVSYISSVHGDATRYDLDSDFNEDIEISGNTVTKLDTANIKSSVSFETGRQDYSPVTFLFAEGMIDTANVLLTLPEAGDNYDYTPDVAVDVEPRDGSHFTVTSAHWYNEWGVAPETFEGGHKYFIEITLTPDEGYGFSGICYVLFHGSPELMNSPAVNSFIDSEGRLNVTTKATYIPGEAHGVSVIDGMASYDRTETDNEYEITDACAGERVWVTAGVDDIEDDEFILPGTYSAYSDDVAFIGEEMYSFIMNDDDVEVRLSYETAKLITCEMDLRGGAVYEASELQDQNGVTESYAIRSLLFSYSYKSISEWDEELGKSVMKFDIDGDESYDLANADNSFYLLETSSLNDPSGKLNISIDKKDGLFRPMREMTLIYADSTLKKHKINLSGGIASTKKGDYEGKYRVIEAYAGEKIYVIPDINDLGDDGYTVQGTDELYLNGQEVNYEGEPRFTMPDSDANIVYKYEKAEHYKTVMDLRDGSYTAPEYDRYSSSELYGMYFILFRESADMDTDYNEETHEWTYMFNVDGYGGYDIMLDYNTRTFSLLPTSSLCPASGREALTISREDAYSVPMRTLTILLYGTDEEQTPHKINVNGGFATNDLGDKITEQYAGEAVHLNTDPAAAPAGKYIYDAVFESDDAELSQEGNFVMPGNDVTVNVRYEFRNQTPVTLDLTEGSKTIEDQLLFYDIAVILAEGSKRTEEEYNENLDDYLTRYDIDGDGTWDIFQSNSDNTYTKLNNDLTGVKVIKLSADKAGTHANYPLSILFGKVTIGDVNNDGFVDVNDATLIQKYAVKKISLTPEQLYAADVNNDGYVDVKDATDIQKFAVKKITEFEKKA